MNTNTQSTIPADKIEVLEKTINSFAGFCERGLNNDEFWTWNCGIKYPMTKEKIYAKWIASPEAQSLLQQLFKAEEWISVETIEKHSLEPGNLLYNSNALAGEAGEVANMVKKIHMATVRPEWVTQNENSLPTIEHFRQKLTEELSDVLFYLLRVASDNGCTIQDLTAAQKSKLERQSKKYGRTFLK